MRAPNASVVGKNRDFQQISGYRINECWSVINNYDGSPCSLPHRLPRMISESCLLQPAWMTMTKRTEHNLIVILHCCNLNGINMSSSESNDKKWSQECFYECNRVFLLCEEIREE